MEFCRFFADNYIKAVNKRFNFEDTIFLLNLRIRMVKDLLRLDIEPELFYRQTAADIEFISSILNILIEKFLTNLKFLDRETEADNLLDAEWQFSQLLNEISNNTNPFSQTQYPETQAWIKCVNLYLPVLEISKVLHFLIYLQVPELLHWKQLHEELLI
jgi:hypothetical protein